MIFIRQPTAKQMKYCKVWPDACAGLALPNSNSRPTGNLGAVVEPKAVAALPDNVQQAVEETVEGLLVKAFPDAEIEDLPRKARKQTPPRVVRDPFSDAAQKSEEDPETAPIQHALLAPVRSVPPVDPVWVAFGAMALIGLLAFMSLYQRITTLESWLHGRLAASA